MESRCKHSTSSFDGEGKTAIATRHGITFLIVISSIGVPIALSPRSISISSRAFRKQLDENDTSHKAAHMRPERHTAMSVAVIRDRTGRTAHKLHQEPVAQHDPRMQITE